MFQLNVYCRRALNTIPPRGTRTVCAVPCDGGQGPAQRFGGRIPRGFFVGGETLEVAHRGAAL